MRENGFSDTEALAYLVEFYMEPFKGEPNDPSECGPALGFSPDYLIYLFILDESVFFFFVVFFAWSSATEGTRREARLLIFILTCSSRLFLTHC